MKPPKGHPKNRESALQTINNFVEILRRLRALGALALFARKFADRPRASRQRFQNRSSTSRRQKWRDFLINLFIRLREKLEVLSRRRRRKFLHSNREIHFHAAHAFLERIEMQLSQLLRRVLLGKSPVGHADLRTEREIGHAPAGSSWLHL